MRRLDAGEINRDEARRIIDEEFGELYRSVTLFGDSQQGKDAGSTLGRAAAVDALGADLSAFRGNRRPRAAQARGRPCPTAGGRSSSQSRCF